MTFSVESTLARAGLLLNAAQSTLATATTDNAEQGKIASAVLDTAADHTRLLAQAVAAPSEIDLKQDASQRAHETARLLCHVGRMLAELRFTDWDAGETVAALVSAATIELDAVSLALERQAGAERLATAA